MSSIPSQRPFTIENPINHPDDHPIDSPDDGDSDMDASHGCAPLSFLDRVPPTWADIEIITIGSGERRPYDEERWRRAMVVVERGEIRLECIRGGRRTFGTGAVLWTVGLDLVSLYNDGDEPVVLSVVQRRRRRN